MNLTDKQKSWITWGIIAVLFVVCTVLGITLPFPLPPAPTTSQGITGFDRIAVRDGLAASPSFTFNGDNDTGFYRIGANDFGVAVNGTKYGEFSSAGFTGYIVPSAEGGIVYETTHDVVAADINTGHTLVTVPAAKSFRLVNVTATATVATCTTSTSVYLKVGTTTLVTWTTANLVRNTLLQMTTSGVTLPADGASFTAGTAGDDVTVISNSNDTAACTVRFVLDYVLQ